MRMCVKRGHGRVSIEIKRTRVHHRLFGISHILTIFQINFNNFFGISFQSYPSITFSEKWFRYFFPHIRQKNWSRINFKNLILEIRELRSNSVVLVILLEAAGRTILDNTSSIMGFFSSVDTKPARD